MPDNKVQIIIDVEGNVIPATSEMTKAFETLKVRSVASINEQKQAIAKAYETIKNSGIASAEEIQHAERAKYKALADLNKEYELGQQSFFSKLKESWLAITAAAAGFLVVANKIKDYIEDVAHMAGRYEELGISMYQAGKNVGYARGEMDSLQKALQETGIAAIESRETLVRMAASNIDLAQSAKLARAAQDLAVVGAMDSSQAFERLVYAVQSAQVEMVRTIGLNVNFEEGYKKMAAQIGVNTAQLTEYQKIQSRVNTVLEGARNYQGLYEQAMTSAEKQQRSLTRYIDNYKVAFGEAFQPAYLRMVEAKTEAYKNLTKAVSDPKLQYNLKAIANTFADIYEWGSKIISIMPSVISSVAAASRETGRGIALWNTNVDVWRRSKEIYVPSAPIPQELWSEDEKAKWIKVYEDARKGADDLKKSVGDVKNATNDASDAAKKLAEEWKNMSRSLEEKIVLMDLEGFDRQRKEIELEVEDLRKKFGDKPLITKYFDVATAASQRQEVQKELEKLEASWQREEDKIIENTKKAIEDEKKRAEEMANAQTWLTDQINQATLDEFDYKRANLLQEYEERARILGWTEEMYKAFYGNLQKIDEEEANARIEHQRGAAYAIINLQHDTVSSAIALLDLLGQRNKAAAILGISIATAMEMIRAWQTTISAAMLAFASQLIPGDPTSLARATAAYAAVKAWGIANMALIAAAGIVKAGSVLAGGGGSVSGGGGYQYTTPTTPKWEKETEEKPRQLIVQFHIYGNVFDNDKLAREMLPSLYKAINDNVH
jgi:hypothetical protein